MESKEKLLKLRHDFYTSDKVSYDSIDYFTRIEKDLDRLEQIENAKPSEALGLFENLMEQRWGSNDFNFAIKVTNKKEYETIKQALIKAQENENKAKAFDIIKEKNINVFALKEQFKKHSDYSYNNYFNNSSNYHNGLLYKYLTEEEFNLLKEVLS